MNETTAADSVSTELMTLLDELRTSGFDIGARQYVMAHELWMQFIWQENGANDVARLRSILAPVLCKTLTDQRAFESQFDAWIDRQAVAPSVDGDHGNGLAEDGLIQTAKNERKHIVAILAASAVAMVTVLFTAAYLIDATFHTSPKPATNADPAIDAPSPDNVGFAHPGRLDSDQPKPVREVSKPKESTKLTPKPDPPPKVFDQNNIKPSGAKQTVPAKSPDKKPAPKLPETPQTNSDPPRQVAPPKLGNDSSQDASLRRTVNRSVDDLNKGEDAALGKPASLPPAKPDDSVGLSQIDDADQSPADLAEDFPERSSEGPPPLNQSDPHEHIELTLDIETNEAENTRSIAVLAILAAVPLVLCMWFVADWCWMRWAHRYLVKRHAESTPKTETRSIGESDGLLFHSPHCGRSLQQLRRHFATASSTLDVKATAEATSRNAGLYRAITRKREILPEYIVLIERFASHDHQAKVVDQLLRAFDDNGVTYQQYYFDSDARFCYRPAPNHELVLLSELQRRHSQDRLLFFCDPERLIDPICGTAAPYISQFEQWEERYLFAFAGTTESRHFESEVACHFRVLHAKESGLSRLADEMSGAVPTSEHGSSEARYPTSLQHDQARWFEPYAPDKEDVDVLVNELKRFLGDAGFFWLCSCAVYPEISWAITRFLGRNLKYQGERLFQEDRLLSLARLPWFRHAEIPNWLRFRLVQELSSDQDRAVREAFAVMLTNVGDPSNIDDLTFAAETDGLTARLARKVFRYFARAESGKHPAKEYVFRSFMMGRLAVRLPSTIRNAILRTAYCSTSTRAIFAGFALVGFVSLSSLYVMHANRSSSAQAIDWEGPVLTTKVNRVLASMTKVDAGQIKFDHALHMRLGQPSTDGGKDVVRLKDLSEEMRAKYRRTMEKLNKKHPGAWGTPEDGSLDISDEGLVQLDCLSCHEYGDPPTESGSDPLLAGRHMKQITFNDHCASCHGLSFVGQEEAGTSVPHGATWTEIEPLLRKNAKKILSKRKKSNPTGIGVLKRPNGVIANEAVISAMVKDERMLLREQCIKCHDSNLIDDDEAIRAAQTSTVPLIPSHFLEHAVFSHSLHEGLDCSYCHPAAFQENDRASVPDQDLVMIESAESCIGCHQFGNSTP